MKIGSKKDPTKKAQELVKEIFPAGIIQIPAIVRMTTLVVSSRAALR